MCHGINTLRHHSVVHSGSIDDRGIVTCLTPRTGTGDRRCSQAATGELPRRRERCPSIMEHQHSSPTIGPADIALPPTSAIDLTWLLTETRRIDVPRTIVTRGGSFTVDGTLERMSIRDRTTIDGRIHMGIANDRVETPVCEHNCGVLWREVRVFGQDGCMQFAGVLPEDAPDPRLERGELLKRMPIPIIEFAAQPSLEVADFNVSTTGSGRGLDEMAVSVSATLWRNPVDKSDPVNLADLDDVTRRSIEEVPPWPRPAWLIEYVERMRYPMLWEAVQTTWHREESERSTLDVLLAHHTNHILMNQFRQELGLSAHDWDSAALTSERAVRRGVDVMIDGVPISGVEIDTDPFVYAVGAKLPRGGTLTAVIPREHLPYLTLEFVQRSPG